MKRILIPLLVTFCISLNSITSAYAGIVTITAKNEQGKILFSANKKDFIDPTIVPSLFILNNKTYSNIYPVVINGYPYLPIRDVFDLIGGSLTWTPGDKVVVSYGKDLYTFEVGSSIILKNNIELTNSLAIKKINSKIYIPARFFSDNLHFNLKYDSPTIQYSGTIRFLPVVFLQDNTEETLSMIKGFLYKNSKIIPFENMAIKKDATFINNNFPEQIPNNIFYETYVNKTSNLTGKVRYFASHANVTKENINYIIRFENTSSTATTIVLYHDSSIERDTLFLQEMEKGQLEHFYGMKSKGEKEAIILQPNEKKDFVIQDIINKEFFSTIMDMQIDGNITLTSFIVPSKDKTPSTKHVTPSIAYDYPYSPKSYKAYPVEEMQRNYLTYSGKGDGYQIYADGVIYASSIKESSMGFETGTTDTNINQNNGLEEIIDIELTEPRGINNEITKATWVMNLPYVEEHGAWLKNKPRNYGNLGNWNAEYFINTKLVNDTEEVKTFKLYLFSELYAAMGLNISGDFTAKVIDNELYYNDFKRTATKESVSISINDEMKLWKALEITVKPNEEREITYMYILGTNSSSGVYHIWTTE